MKHYRLQNIGQGQATVVDAKQGIVRGYVTRYGENWAAWYPCPPWKDTSGGYTRIMFARRYRAGDSKKMPHLIHDIAVSPVTGRKTGGLLFRTRDAAAAFVVANG